MWIYDCLRPGDRDQTASVGIARPADTSLTPNVHFSILSRSFSPTRIKSKKKLIVHRRVRSLRPIGSTMWPTPRRENAEKENLKQSLRAPRALR
jgi:hypothetical protein